MKPKKPNKKLSLNKKTIARLDMDDMNQARGGSQTLPGKLSVVEATCIAEPPAIPTKE